MNVPWTDNDHTYSLATLGGAKATEAIKSISRSGTTFTATRCDGTTFSFTQQDNNTTYGNASTSAAGLVSTGTQSFAGSKTFTGDLIVQNSALNSYIYFKGNNLDTNAAIYAASQETSAGKYGNVQFLFREWSPDSSGNRTNYYESYFLPAVTTGLTENKVYNILTEKHLGYTQSGKNYPVQISSGKLYVNVPWTDNNTTYNFSGTTFYSGNNANAEHNANNAVKNGNYYYSSNGPATSLGASTTDGALYVQSYSDSWVGQIAQDYRNGKLYVRGKNNGTWQSWLKVPVMSEVLPITGGTLTGTLSFTSAALPSQTGLTYILGINAFADGGTARWSAASNVSVGYASTLTCPRVAVSANHLPGKNLTVVREYTNGTSYNLPSNHFYHIYETQGSDVNYGTQLALGMTTNAAYYRKYSGGTWDAWHSLINTNTWRGIQDNLTSSTNTTESLSAKQGYLLANGSARDSTKLPLAGGTMTGQIQKAGSSVSWFQGRDYAALRVNSYSGYSAIISQKTTNGTWDIGTYTSNVLWCTYITDANHDSSTNTVTAHYGLKPSSGGDKYLSDAVSGITRSGTTFTATRLDGTTFTFTQQDTNTTYMGINGVKIYDSDGYKVIAPACEYLFTNTYTLSSNADLNALPGFGVFECPSASVAATISNTPVTNNNFTVLNFRASYNRYKQLLFGAATVHYRYNDANGWQAWKKFTLS